jgi:hypothetical protein
MSEQNVKGKLAPLDWLASILCWPLGCGLGLYYLVKGDPRAGKVLLVSVVVSAVLSLLGIVVVGSGAVVGR